MGIQGRRLGRSRIALAGTVAVLASAGSAFALQGLPPGGQVNNDPAAGINPALSVGSDDPANADVVGGALTAGKPAVPWSVFRQATSGHDQIFSRSFAGGAWTTRGSGTVGGSSSAAPTFSGSLNFDQNQDGEAPAIDFAGAGRTVPWATWYEDTTGTNFGAKNIFASRFDAVQNKWVFAGQGRGAGGTNNVPVPSLNIHTNRDAENPSVAGGNAGTPTTAPDPTKPGPWITWQEKSNGGAHTDQIFVERPLGPGRTDCTGVTPGGSATAPLGGFCWQQTGIDRVAGDPSLNVDPTRDGVEPDIAFTGAQDSVPWVVWYEQNGTGTPVDGNQLQSNEMVFAARGITDAGAGVDGQMHWQVVGQGLQGVLDTTGANHGFGTCGENAANEAQCSLNANTSAEAEDPRVAGGTMNPANPTVPWVIWDEGPAGHHQVFVSRFVPAVGHFVLANNSQPISPAGVDATRADITFSGNTPYVTYRTTDGSSNAVATTGHFVNAANPTFVSDSSTIALTPTNQADVREPISSGCTANPFNANGAACQGAAIGTPLFLFTNGSSPSPRSLFANAYQPDAPVTGAATGVGQSAATVSGSVNPEGARANVSFQFGTTTAYGQSTTAQTTGPDNSADAFSAALTGLPAGTTIHYRAVATSDFGTQVGADQTLTTQKPPAPPVIGKASVGHARVSGRTVSVPITCTGDTSCTVSLRLTATETRRGHRIIAVSARKAKLRHKTVVLGTATATVKAGGSQTVRISLNRTGRKLLAARHKLTAKLAVTQRISGRNRTISTQKVTFKAPKPKHGGG
jgi:hypothetical protein